ncbi:MAG: YceI family protein [Pseudomonadota bacterium]|nr:YceI family protein [Pseudomonadota bacterium]
MKHLTPFLLSAVLTIGTSMTASAVEYKAIQTEKSKVTFQYKQMGVAMDGQFKKFAAQLSFDPAKPAAAQAQIEIDLASIDAGSSDADDEVVGKTWFNVKAFPKATFVVKQIKATGANQFDVTGVLTIKGKSQDIKFPLKLVTQGNTATFTGGFVMRRADFAIGEGMWAKFDVVANDIQVNFQLTANSGK